MADLDVDVLIIGWGKGGKTLAAALAQQGSAVALVERSATMSGGSCINVNCVPTKTLIHDADARPASVDPADWFRTAVTRRDGLTAQLRERNHAMLADADQVTLISGRARFIDAHTVAVSSGNDELLVHAETVVVNTGTVPAVPGIEGLNSGRVHDSVTIQHVEPFPERLVIVGSGFVGLEFAHMFASFGAQVTLLGRQREFLPHLDRDVADEVRSILQDEGIDVRLGAEVERVEESDDALRLALADQRTVLTADALLFATGRRSTASDLDVEAAGIALDERGFIVVDETLRTSVPHIFAMGDVNGGPQFTYISWDDFRIVRDQLCGDGRRSTADRVAVPSTTFLAPPLAQVGLTEIEARASGAKVLVATKRVADIAVMPRPKIEGDARGLMKVLVDADSDLIVGATLFCIDAQEVINLLALAMRMGTTASQLRDGIWTHPSITEGLSELLAELQPMG